MMGPFRDNNSLDVLRGQNEILQRENALLKKEKELQAAETALQKRATNTGLAGAVKAGAKPAVVIALIAATVATGNVWFLVLILFLAG
jgi:hypothetical protein